MNFQNKNNNLDDVFNARWKANNFSQNGMNDVLKTRKDHFNKMFNIKPKEEWKKEILEANSVNGKVSRLEDNMKNMFSNKNNF